jgi:hypothetical protein
MRSGGREGPERQTYGGRVTEQQAYEAVEELDGYELRRYPAHLVVETGVRGSFESAGNRAFRPLAGYIGGRNADGARMAMTAPVLQEPASDDGDYTIAFVLPAAASPATVPAPSDVGVAVREVGEEWALVARYSGRWSRSSFARHEAGLREAAAQHGLQVVGPARWARFDPPWTPWFLRHNEAVLPVRALEGRDGADPGGSLGE